MDIKLVIYKESKSSKGEFIYTCKLLKNNLLILLNSKDFKSIKRINKKDFSFTVGKIKLNTEEVQKELEKYFSSKIELIRLV